MEYTHSINPWIQGKIQRSTESGVILYLEDDTFKIHNINFKNVYYFPGAPKLFVSPKKWSRDRGGGEIVRERTYLKEMSKSSILV